jgi:CubicO group peptidase (beta-lactamase class C family)
MNVSWILVAAGVLACSAAGEGGEARASAATTESRRLSLDSAAIATALSRADSLPRLRSIVIQWNDTIIGEKYYRGAGPNRGTNVKSASKSIVSALVGIAIAEGKIRSLEATIGELLPTETRGLDPLKRAITVRDLISMRAGLEPTSFGNYGSWVTSSNWVRNALSRPMVDSPGGRMLYSTGSTHLLSAILSRATGQSTFAYARDKLARPLGIELRPWQRDPQGIYFGGNDMYLTPRDLLKIGTLYLKGGELEGRRVLPSEWIDSSFVPRTVSPFNGNSYGYGWWQRTGSGFAVNYAWGYGGQFIFVVPEKSLVVVVTSDAEAARDGGHNREVHRLVESMIVPAIPDR